MARRRLFIAVLPAGEEPDWASAAELVDSLTTDALQRPDLIRLVRRYGDPVVTPLTLEDQSWNDYLLHRVKQRLDQDMRRVFAAGMLDCEPDFLSFIVHHLHVCLAIASESSAEMFEVMGRLKASGALRAAGFEAN